MRFTGPLLAISAAMLLLLPLPSNAQTNTLQSPDGVLELTVTLNNGIPWYSVKYEATPFIRPSSLGLNFEGQTPLNRNLEITDVSTSTYDETWTPVWGTSSSIRDHYNELELELQETKPPNRKFTLVFRAYNDGVALRYKLPEQENLGSFRLTDEYTTFTFADDYMAFAMDRGGFGNNYEGNYLPGKLSEIASDALIGPPLLVDFDTGWAAVMEAHLDDYAGMSLQVMEQQNTRFISTLAPRIDDETVKVKATTPHKTPWRVIQVAPTAGALIGSNLLWNLNPSSKIADTSWIKPSQVIWPWWNGRIAADSTISGEPSTALMKYYTDFAAKHDIPALLVDAGWYSLEGEAWDAPLEQNALTMEESRKDYYDIREVIDFAHSKGVDVHVWIHLWTLREDPENILATYAEWGVDGIKVDNHGNENQELVNDLRHIVEVAAEHELMVDFHGSYKSTGIERTWPNFMTREGVQGLEYSKWSDLPEAVHNVTIPYTRMLTGPMDYTPGAFDLDGTEKAPKYVQTTRAQQIAMYVVYFSPLQMLVDYPGAYQSAPAQFEFVRNIPVSWNETRFLQGNPGDYIVLARRKGDTWFVGGLTNDASRSVSLSLDFLPEDTSWDATILKDGAHASNQPEDVAMEHRTVEAGEAIDLQMASTGGFTLRLVPRE